MTTVTHFFTEQERVTLITSMVFSRLYYAKEIWLNECLTQTLMKKLYSQSGASLRIINRYESYASLHKRLQRFTPQIMMSYTTAVLFYDLFHNELPYDDFIGLFNVICNDDRNPNFVFVRSNAKTSGLNCIINRLRLVSNKIEKSWLNLSRDSFKVKCKRIFSPM